MNQLMVKKVLPHVVAIFIFFALSAIFFSPFIFDGKVLHQGDNEKASAVQSEINKYNEETGKAPLWTNACFSGMPAVQIYQVSKGNLTQYIFRTLLLGNSVTAPHSNILLAMLCMYLLLTVMRLDWRISLIGSIVFGLSTFNMDIIAAGHSTKMVALAYTPAILAGAILAFRGKYMLGAAMFALFTALQMYANHYQITYYTFLIVAVLGISELVNAIRTNTSLGFGKAALSLIGGLAIAVLTNLTTIWTTLEYQAESTPLRWQIEPMLTTRVASGSRPYLARSVRRSWAAAKRSMRSMSTQLASVRKLSLALCSSWICRVARAV